MQVKQQDAADLNRSGSCWVLIGSIGQGERKQLFEIRKSPFRIGRRRDLELQIPTPVVSSSHARILVTSDFAVIQDCGSTNGTWVNGRRITGDTMISDGDVIEIGTAVFRLTQEHAIQTRARTEHCLGNTVVTAADQALVAERSMNVILRDRAVLPCYQALHELGTGCVRGYEFLARAEPPGLESASQLFAQATAVGKEVELSRICRDRAMYYSPLLAADVPIFVNTHPAESLLDDVVPQMQNLRRQYPDCDMVLEIHEAAVTDPSLVREVRKRLAEFGVRLAFDDFGRGQARIRELICAPSDYIKFDSALISDLQNVQTEQFAFFRSIINGIQSAGAITVAEGVETEGMAQVCRDVGFDLVQGFLFSYPTIVARS